MTLTNISEVSKVVESLNIKKLKPNVIEFVISNLKGMKENGELKKLSEVMLTDVLFKLNENKNQRKILNS